MVHFRVAFPPLMVLAVIARPGFDFPMNAGKAFQSLGEKMMRIGWAGAISRDPQKFNVGYSPKGLRQMKALSEALNDFGEMQISMEEFAVLRALAKEFSPPETE